ARSRRARSPAAIGPPSITSSSGSRNGWGTPPVGPARRSSSGGDDPLALAPELARRRPASRPAGRRGVRGERGPPPPAAADRGRHAAPGRPGPGGGERAALAGPHRATQRSGRPGAYRAGRAGPRPPGRAGAPLPALVAAAQSGPDRLTAVSAVPVGR